MKLHDLRPADGSRKARTRVGRGIAAGKGKTAGRGTKGQKSRAGNSIPAGFEGGQTPIHRRIPKLRGFKNRFKVEYEVVNLGAIAQLVQVGAFPSGDMPGSPRRPASRSAAPITINQDILRAVGLVRTLSKPLKVLGHGELDSALFVVADAFSKSAVAKIEAAGGSVSVLETPSAAAARPPIATPAETLAAAPLAAATPVAEMPAETLAAATPVAEPPPAPPSVAAAPAAEPPPAKPSETKPFGRKLPAVKRPTAKPAEAKPRAARASASRSAAKPTETKSPPTKPSAPRSAAKASSRRPAPADATVASDEDETPAVTDAGDDA